MMRFVVRKSTSVGIVPSLKGFTRSFSLSAFSSPKEKTASRFPGTNKIFNHSNFNVCAALFGTATFNFLYLKDYDGIWARKAEREASQRKSLAKNTQEMKLLREKLQKLVQKMKPVGSGKQALKAKLQ